MLSVRLTFFIRLMVVIVMMQLRFDLLSHDEDTATQQTH